MTLRRDADFIMNAALEAAKPDAAVKKALKQIKFSDGRLILIAVGKAAWQMAKVAYDELGTEIDNGIVITKYGHKMGEIGNLEIFEAGHPVSDENSYSATQKAIDSVSALNKNDNVLFLVSGGGSALFEKPLISEEENKNITKQLLECGADIVEINTVRKHLSAVKGGRFAKICSPASIYTVVLSDIIGDPLDMIASGPAYPDSSTADDALKIAEKYSLALSAQARSFLETETPKKLDNVTTFVTGSVRQLCESVSSCAEKLGYEPRFLTASLNCVAREAGAFLAAIARDHQDTGKSLAFIAGGETVVHITGKGKGGRNQEIALSAAAGIAGLKDTCVFSLGSDGTDGPTDAAGGYCDGDTATILTGCGVDIYRTLENNDSYNALRIAGGLIVTGPTGTNVNDVSVVLIKRTH